MPLARLAPALAAIVLPAVFVAAQQDRSPPPRTNAWTAMAEVALADLKDEAKYAAACERLERAGPRVVDFVRERLTAAARATASPRQVRGLLYLLAKRGKEALPALPELRTMLREIDDLVQDEAVEQSLCWALAAVLPFVDPELGMAIHHDAETMFKRRYEAVGMMCAMAIYADDPGDQVLLTDATSTPPFLPACRWLCARADDFPYDRRTFVEALDAHRRTMQACPPYRTGTFVDASEVTAAWLALSRAPLDALAARALLRHFDPARRTEAISWLRDAGAELPVRERADLVAALWDAEAAVREAAAATLAAWGKAGIVGLAALRQLQHQHTDPAFQAVCASTGDAIVAAFAGDAAADRTLLAAVDLCLQGRRNDAPAIATASASALTRCGELLHMAAWCDAERLDAALHCFAAAGELDHDARQALVGWLWLGNGDVGATAWSWLAKDPAATSAAFLQGTNRSFDELLLAGLLRQTLTRDDRGGSFREALEATAWLLDGVATREQRLEACAKSDPRRIVRSLAAMLMDGRQANVDAEVLAKLRTGDVDDRVVVTFGPDKIECRADLRPLVRVLAALQTAAQGLPLPIDDADLDGLLTTWCGTTARDLPATLARWRRDGELEHRLDAIEADARKLLGVRAHLTWPRLQKP